MESFKEYCDYDAIGLAFLLDSKQVSPNELLEEVIELTEVLNPSLNAVVTKLYDFAKSSIESGLPDGPFKGVPFLLKEFESLSGAPLTHSCKYFKENITDFDSELVSRFKNAGLVIFGKTNAPEFSLSFNTESRLYGSTHNPWDVRRTAGGSSGGAAAAVASGIVPAAQGSDGVGSIRVPASCCGLFGLKPTRGRTPWGPRYGESWSGMHGMHVVSRSVRDSAALLDLTAGPDIGAPYWATPPTRSYLDERFNPANKLKVAYSHEPVFEALIDSNCVTAMRIAATLMESLGHVVKEAKPSISTDELGETVWLIGAANTLTEVKQYASETKRDIDKMYFENITWNLMEWCKTKSAADYAKWIQIIHRTGREFAQFFEEYDLFITPTLAKPPIKLGELNMISENLEDFISKFSEFGPYTFLSNLSGNPAMSVPLHWTHDELPIGVQFVGRYGDETTLFKIATQLEKMNPWIDKKPPIHATNLIDRI